MLNLDLNRWLLQTKNPKIPADEASLYGLSQLYSRHALAYTMGSIWSTLELHGNYSVNELKRHCDIHLVFLEGGILGQLHKKPTIPRLMGIPSKSTGPRIVVIKDANSDSVKSAQMRKISPDKTAPDESNQVIDLDLDHTYASPTLQVHKDVNDNSVENDRNLTLDDMPLGVSGMQPLETSSVISDPADGGVLESIPTTSIDSNNLTDQNVEDTKHIAKKARLKSCIIKLMELSNSEHEKWLTSENSSSQINKTTESIESSSSSSTVSRYNMRNRPVSVSSRPSRKRQHAVNYTEQGVKDSGNDSDFEPKLKPPPSLDNKSFPTPTRIAMQKEIELNKATKRNASSAFPDTNKTPKNDTLNTGVMNQPNAPLPPPPKPVPDATNTQSASKLPHATQNLLPDKISRNNVVPDAANKTTTETTDDTKPTRGVFKTKCISIRRTKDPRTFKCSCCDTRASSLKELNAHYISNHHQVSCDICGKSFSTPGSLRKHRCTHAEERSQFKCCSCDRMFLFESQLKSHCHMHRRSRNYICASANCEKLFKHSGDLASHARSHGKPHKCAHCDYENTDMRNLKSHQRTHSRAAPFKCKLCRQSFVHINQLLWHQPKCSKNIKPETETD